MKKKTIVTCMLASMMTVPLMSQTPTKGPAPSDTLASAANFQGGSYDKVSIERMNKGLVTNSLSALSGQSAGVQISNNNHMAMINSVRVRGTNSLVGGNDPLVIIDGVACDVATLTSVYPADIESFTILKNASETAQYGSRGAAGVILVTTKKGHSGKFRISYDGILSIESAYKNVEMLRREEYLKNAELTKLPFTDGGYDTNFPEALVRTGYVENHHVSFGGGTETNYYRASIGYMKHNMVLRVNGSDNIVAKLDVSQKAFEDRITVNLGVNGSSNHLDNIYDDQLLFYSAAAHNPTFSKGKNNKGAWDLNTTASQIKNPISLLDSKDHNKNLLFNTHIKIAYDIWPNLKASLFGSYSFSSNEHAQYISGKAFRGETKNEYWLGNLILDYWWDFDSEHRMEISGLAEFQRNIMTEFHTTVEGIKNDEFSYYNLMAGAQRFFGGTGSSYDRPSLGSLAFSAKFEMLHRFTFGATLRADGTSKLAKGNRWGFFPSLSAEWDILKESFMKNVPIISQFKMRVGMGLSGNLGSIDSYNSLVSLMPLGIVPNNGSPTVALGYFRNANNDLKWETCGSLNVGFDIGLLNNRVVMTAECYFSKTHNMLYEYDVSVPPFTFDKMFANLGEMSNSGFELGLGATPLKTRDMELNINLNLSRQVNKLNSLSGYYKGEYMNANDITPIGKLNGAGFHGGNDIVYQIVGEPLGVFYLPHCKGLGTEVDGTHYYEIEDLNGDGVGDSNDRYIAGQATPKWTLGSNISLRYKDFDVSLQMNGAFGHKIYNGTSLTYMNLSSLPDYNVMKEAPQRKIYDQEVTDYWLERGDYLNFDYLSIGWNIPIRNTRYVNSLRVSLSVNNIGTITSYSGLTPMINSFVVNNTLGIDDKRNYPPYRSYTIGVNLSF